jgi:hypothetical protein
MASEILPVSKHKRQNMGENWDMATYPMTDTDRRRQKVDAQVRYDEAAETVAGIIFQLNTIGQRAASIAARLRKVPITVEDYTTSEGPLFALTADDFKDVNLSAIYDLTHALVAARKDMAGVEALARALGCKV